MISETFLETETTFLLIIIAKFENYFYRIVWMGKVMVLHTKHIICSCDALQFMEISILPKRFFFDYIIVFESLK